MFNDILTDSDLQAYEEKLRRLRNTLVATESEPVGDDSAAKYNQQKLHRRLRLEIIELVGDINDYRKAHHMEPLDESIPFIKKEKSEEVEGNIGNARVSTRVFPSTITSDEQLENIQERVVQLEDELLELDGSPRTEDREQKMGHLLYQIKEHQKMIDAYKNK